MTWHCRIDGRPTGPYSRDDLENLLRSGQIDRRTMVWREGMTPWVALDAVDELKDLLTAAEADAERAPVQEGRLEEPSLLEHDHIATDTSTAGPHPHGGPWSRYLARQLDIMILALLVGIGIELILLEVSMTAYRVLNLLGQSITSLVILAGAFGVNALVLTVFGNSPGKAMFGLRAVPIGGTGRFDLLGNLKRECRVWFYGVAVGIPIIALFTMFRNYREVSAGRSATYDRRFARMEVRPISSARRTVAMVFAVGVLVGSAALAFWELRYEQQVAAPETWTNPISGRSTTIPGGWIVEPLTGDNGFEVLGFSAADSSKMVFLAADDASVDLWTLDQYAQSIERSFAGSVTLSGRWRQVEINGTPMLRKDGQEIPKRWPTTLLLAKFGNRFWRIIVMKPHASDRSDPEKMPLIQALIRTLS